MEQAETLLKIMKLQNQRTRMISVTSGKGGVGKTNISTNLGIILSRMGKEVVLLDGDLGLANVNVVLGMIPKYNLYNVLKGEKKIEEVILECEGGLKVVAGASGFRELSDLEYGAKEGLLNELEKLSFADIVLIDTGAGISEDVMRFVMGTEEVIIVTTPEPTAIADAYGLIKSVVVKGGNMSFKLLVNRVRNENEGKRIGDRVVSIGGQFLGVEIEYMGYVYEDEKVWRSVIKQVPFVVMEPKSRVSRCIVDIAKSLVGEGGVEEEEKRGGVRGFFDHLLRYYGDRGRR